MDVKQPRHQNAQLLTSAQVTVQRSVAAIKLSVEETIRDTRRHMAARNPSLGKESQLSTDWCASYSSNFRPSLYRTLAELSQERDPAQPSRSGKNSLLETKIWRTTKGKHQTQTQRAKESLLQHCPFSVPATVGFPRSSHTTSNHSCRAGRKQGVCATCARTTNPNIVASF